MAALIKTTKIIYVSNDKEKTFEDVEETGKISFQMVIFLN